MNVKQYGMLLKDATFAWWEHKVPRLGAALAYYTIFSLGPLMLIIIAIAGQVFGEEAAQGQIVQQIQGLVGEEGAKAIEAMLISARKPSAGIVATVLGVVMLLFGASGVFGQLQDALNTIWGVTPKPGRGLWGFLKDRFLSFAMVVGIAFLLLVSLVVTAALSALGTLFGEWGASVGGQAANFVISFGVITFLFAMIFKVLPDVRLAWRDVWVGAALTSLLFTIGKLLIGLYLGRSSTASAFGAAGSLVVLLIWIYYSAQILFFGAEFTRAYAAKRGSRVTATPNAVPITKEAQARQGMFPRHTEAKRVASP